jgi:hypothetical protein
MLITARIGCGKGILPVPPLTGEFTVDWDDMEEKAKHMGKESRRPMLKEEERTWRWAKSWWGTGTQMAETAFVDREHPRKPSGVVDWEAIRRTEDPR